MGNCQRKTVLISSRTGLRFIDLTATPGKPYHLVQELLGIVIASRKVGSGVRLIHLAIGLPSLGFEPARPVNCAVRRDFSMADPSPARRVWEYPITPCFALPAQAELPK